MKKLRLVILAALTISIFPLTVSAQSGLDQRVAELSQQISKEMALYQKTAIAVVEFMDLRGTVTDFGHFLAEELITRLFQSKKFKVIERQLLNKILAEQALSLTGVIDPNSAKQIGRVLGVDAIVSGTVTDLAQSLRVNARLISTQSGEIFAVASTEIFKDESVMILLTTKTPNPVPGAKPSAQPAMPSKNSTPSSNSKVDVKNFTFEIIQCKLSGTTLTCDLFITNNDQDRELVLGAKGNDFSRNVKSRIFDDSANEYGAIKCHLGEKANAGEVTNSLVSGIPIKANLVFDNVSPETRLLTLLEIGFYAGDRFKAQLRNIPIIK